jgi:hypothetical protein
MTPKHPPLTRDIHIRLDEETEKLITQIARENNLRDSTLCRVILQRALPQYTRNRFYAWSYSSITRWDQSSSFSSDSMLSMSDWYSSSKYSVSMSNNNNKGTTSMRFITQSKTDTKLMSLRQFVEYLRQNGVFAVEVIESDKEEITIKLMFENLWTRISNYWRKDHWWVWS